VDASTVEGTTVVSVGATVAAGEVVEAAVTGSVAGVASVVVELPEDTTEDPAAVVEATLPSALSTDFELLQAVASTPKTTNETAAIAVRMVNESEWLVRRGMSVAPCGQM
ncbi:MAG: hypothetical protein WCC60_06485, partial [Ilumatobacteraceae bacterium]